MTSSHRLVAGAALAALAAAIVLVSPATAAAPSALRTDFKVLWVTSTGNAVYMSQDHVGAYPARFVISAPGSKLVDTTVKAQGWKFPRVRFKPSTTYAVQVTTQPGPTTYALSLPVS